MIIAQKIQFCGLHQLIEGWIVALVHQGGEPPTEPLGLPNSRKRARSIGLKIGCICGLVEAAQALVQIMDIRCRRIQSLCAGGRNNMRGITA